MTLITGLLLLLCALLCPQRVLPEWGFDSDLADEIAQHLHITPDQLLHSTVTWGPIFQVHRQLHGTGFHRSLSYNISYTGDPGQLHGCQVSLLQPLPSSIIADPYQLYGLVDTTAQHSQSNSVSSSDSSQGASLGGFWHKAQRDTPFSFKLFGSLDLELPAPACEPTVLLLQFNLSRPQQPLGGPSARLTAPLHAKYPQPQAFRYQGWKFVMTGHVKVAVPLPWMVMDCRTSKGEVQLLAPPLYGVSQGETATALQQEQQQQQLSKQCTAGRAPASQEDQQLLWQVPAGNMIHLQLVSWGTVLITTLCAAILTTRAVHVTNC